jgi:hypothetical protein
MVLTEKHVAAAENANAYRSMDLRRGLSDPLTPKKGGRLLRDVAADKDDAALKLTEHSLDYSRNDST